MQLFMAHLLYLRSFMAVYRHGSFSKAARVLNLTQPAVSRHLQRLEQQLGTKLFERLPRGVSPTATARELERISAPHLDALEAVRSLGASRGRTANGAVFVGTVRGFTKLVIAAVAHLISEKISVDLRALTPPLLLEAVLQRQVEIAVTLARIPHRQVEYEPLYEGPLVLVCSPMLRQRLRPSAVPRGLPLIDLHGPTSPLSTYWKEVFGVKPDVRPTLMPDYEAAIDAAKTGMGLVVAPECLCRDALDNGSLIVAQRGRGRCQHMLFLAQHRDADATERLALVKRMLKDAANSWASRGGGTAFQPILKPEPL